MNIIKNMVNKAKAPGSSGSFLYLIGSIFKIIRAILEPMIVPALISVATKYPHPALLYYPRYGFTIFLRNPQSRH
jgi:hypothetical protein